ncbi:hypothetical protein BHM03_00044490, partial [Ensete ventricosum]
MLRTGRVTIASLIKSWPGAPLLGRHPNQEDPITVRLDPIVWEGLLSSPPRDLLAAGVASDLRLHFWLFQIGNVCCSSEGGRESPDRAN